MISLFTTLKIIFTKCFYSTSTWDFPAWFVRPCYISSWYKLIQDICVSFIDFSLKIAIVIKKEQNCIKTRFRFSIQTRYTYILNEFISLSMRIFFIVLGSGDGHCIHVNRSELGLATLKIKSAYIPGRFTPHQPHM